MESKLIKTKLDAILNRLANSGRKPPVIVAIVKKQPLANVQEALDCGVKNLGINFVKDFFEFKEGLPMGEVNWHFVGNIQGKKLNKIVGNFKLIHSVGKLDHFRKINSIANEKKVLQKVLLQVNLSNESSKGGFSGESLNEVFNMHKELSGVTICGLMTMPPLESERNYFEELKSLRDSLQKKFTIELPVLSMGTSGDFERAVAAGATHIRLGEVLLGKREVSS